MSCNSNSSPRYNVQAAVVNSPRNGAAVVVSPRNGSGAAPQVVGGTNSSIPAHLSSFASCISPVPAVTCYDTAITPHIEHKRWITQEMIPRTMPATAVFNPIQDHGTTDVCTPPPCAVPKPCAVAAPVSPCGCNGPRYW